MTFLLFLFVLSPALSAATVDLSLGAETGYETGIYHPADSTYGASALVAPAAELGLRWPLNPRWRGEASLRLSDDVYFSAEDNLTAEAGFLGVRTLGKGDLRLGLSSGFFSQPGAIDPDQPSDYYLSAFSAEFRNKSGVEWRLNNTLSALNENGGRDDLREKARLRFYFRPSPWFFPSLGAGAGINASSAAAYRYSEVELLAQGSVAAGEENMFSALLIWGRRFYSDGGNGSAAGGQGSPPFSKSPKKGGGAPATGTGFTAVDHASFLLSYSRDLTENIEVTVQYQYWAFDAAYDSTHRLTAGLAWHLNPL